jgi:poly-gamma-glutamate synthase PgsB/CapB
LIDGWCSEISQVVPANFDHEQLSPEAFATVVRVILDGGLRQAAELELRHRDFRAFARSYAMVPEPGLRAEMLESWMAARVRRRRIRRADRKALQRDLDLDALAERHQRHQAIEERDLSLRFTMLSGALRSLPEDAQHEHAAAVLSTKDFWTNIEDLYRPARPASTRAQILQFLCDALERGGSWEGDQWSPPEVSILILRRANSLAWDARAPRELQVAALRLLLVSGANDARPALLARLVRGDYRQHEGDFLVRAATARLLLQYAEAGTAVALLTGIRDAGEPSEWVRMTWIEILAPHVQEPQVAAFVEQMAWGRGQQDPSERVRALIIQVWAEDALQQISSGPERHEQLATAVRNMVALSAGDPSPLVQESFLAGVRPIIDDEGWVQLAEAATDGAPDVEAMLTRRLAERARGEGCGPRLAFASARLVERLRLLGDPDTRRALLSLEEQLRATPEAGRMRWPVPTTLVEWTRPARLLLQASVDDLGAQARTGRKRWTLMRGGRDGRRAWRFLHELRNPSPAKRQGVLHTVGELPFGQLRCPPEAMAGITSTTVPGEPIVGPAMEGWAPHLPQVSDFLDAVRNRRTVVIEHPHGLTQVSPPTGVRRARALARLLLRFAHYDHLRRRSVEARDESERRAYLAAASELGFSVEILPLELPTADGVVRLTNAEIESFAPPRAEASSVASVGAIEWSRLGEQAWSYMLDPGGNTLGQLAAVVGTFLGLTLFGGFMSNLRIKRWRRRIPLVIGGWGTRGKSGTERLKAALLHGEGLEVVSKTTGCEAMFIHSGPGLEPREIFLYRAYDKASIWEQRDVIRLAAGLGADAMLWECMALNTRYVQILQLDWMRDDIVTLTNCYPDHEDVQGPGCRDVARSISTFVPRRSKLIASEREMLPLVREQAKLRHSSFRAVSDLDAAMISDDLLARFPYREHPKNVALVAAMAAEMGIGFERAVVSMADHVVADLGSLKIFEDVSLIGRTLRFINGHSANERTGFLNNWKSVGLAAFEQVEHPGEWICTVVNNRRDRVPRSQVFARILVGDTRTHAHLVIGTNQSGFARYVDEALGEFLHDIDFGDDPETLDRRFRVLFARLHLGQWGTDLLVRILQSWLVGCGVEPTAVASAIEECSLAELLEGRLAAPANGAAQWAAINAELRADTELGDALESLAETIEQDDLRPPWLNFALREVALHRAMNVAHAHAVSATPEDALAGARELYRTLFLERIHYLENPSSTGDQVILSLVQHLPPGVRAHVLGCQNIKGTGLDFIYRWIAWEKVYGHLRRVELGEPAEALAALAEVERFGDYGVVDLNGALATLARLREGGTMGRTVQPELLKVEAVLRQRLDQRMEAATGAAQSSGAGLSGILTRWFERLFDHLHSIYRRLRSEQILRDLIADRISHDRAALWMRYLTSSQKGGWMKKKPPS